VKKLILASILLGTVLASSFRMLAQANESDNASDVVDGVTRSKVIDGVLNEIERAYVYPDVGKKMVDSVRTRVERHEYDSILKASELADRLTRDLQEVSKDRHLRVDFHPERPLISLNSAPDLENFHAKQRRRNYGFEHAERFPGNIGYLDMRTFEHTNSGGPTAVTAIAFLINTEALIIDLRNNGGGHESMVQLLASYFLSPDPEDLYDSYWREENRTDQNWSFPYVPGSRYGTKKSLYLLIGKHTFSAAETLAYCLHNRKRAILVGETTGGGANNGFPRTVYNEHFTIWIPFGTDIDPLTKTNWEAVGVKPDIEVTEGLALNTAYLSALKSVLESTSDEELKQEIRDAMVTAKEELDAQKHAEEKH